MKFYQIFYTGLGLILIAFHAFWSNYVNVDSITIIIYFILGIPITAKYLIKAKFPGAEFEFRKVIEETKQLVKLSHEQDATSINNRYFETFNLTSARLLIESDPVLALASLRIEIEKKLRVALEQLGMQYNRHYSIKKSIVYLRGKEVLSSEQLDALTRIIDMCNKAVHGHAIVKKEAEEIISLADELNKNFSIGYSINFLPNEDYEKHGLLCSWEHCIEWFSLPKEKTNLSCPVFGHNCPGGISEVAMCNKTIWDLPDDRFVKKSDSK